VQINEGALGTYLTSTFNRTWSKQCDLPLVYD